MNRKKVMIIDDDREMLTFMKGQLEVLYDVTSYTSGEEAIRQLLETENRPDIILLDIVMDGMDGYEVLGKLKENERLKKIPVVFLTGITDEVNEVRGLEMDAVDYLK